MSIDSHLRAQGFGEHQNLIQYNSVNSLSHTEDGERNKSGDKQTSDAWLTVRLSCPQEGFVWIFLSKCTLPGTGSVDYGTRYLKKNKIQYVYRNY